jgi:hypothetical protein
MTDTLTITQTTDSYEYQIDIIRGVDESQEKPAFSIAPPGQAAKNNILLGIQGMQGNIRIQFFLHNDGTDKSNGTAPTGVFADDTVVTIAEQREWLREYIHDPGFDTEWTLTHDTGDEFDGDSVFLESMDIPTLQQDSPKCHEASKRLRRGGSV